MRGIKAYSPSGCTAPVTAFIEGLEPKLRDKLVRQLYSLSQTPRTGLKEPHYKHFAIEKYRDLYELREKGKVIIRIIFTVCPGGDVVLLTAFVKRQKRDTMQALEHSLRILAELREYPEHAVEYRPKEEEESRKRQQSTPVQRPMPRAL